jgi:hypothetical protein
VNITPDMIQALGAALVACLGLVLTAVGFLLRTAHKIGRDAQKVSMALDSLVEIKAAVAKIPILETRLGTVEDAWRATRSDIKHLLRGSHPDMNGEE